MAKWQTTTLVKICLRPILAVNWQMAAVVEICPHPIRIWWQTGRWPLLRKSAQQIAAVANLYSVLAEKWQISASKNKT